MKLLKRIWNSEPVVLVGGLVAGWTAVVALDQTDDSWFIPTGVYVVAVPLVAFMTYLTRDNVTPSSS